MIFANATQDLSVEKKIADVVAGQYLDSTYVAQLFAGVQNSIESALTAHDSPVTFLDSPPESLGLFLGNTVGISGVASGGTATLQVRVWPTLYLTWNDAVIAHQANPSSVRLGKSALFDVTLGTIMAPTEMAPFMPLFTIAEPGAMYLSALGFGLIFLRRIST